VKRAEEISPERVNTNLTSEALSRKITQLTKQLEIRTEGYAFLPSFVTFTRSLAYSLTHAHRFIHSPLK